VGQWERKERRGGGPKRTENSFPIFDEIMRGTKVLFSCQNFLVFVTVVFLFLFGNYYLIID
jgi:hypothetical protein